MPGFGAHLDPKIALLRAVTEMNQMLSSPLLGKPEKGAEKEPMDSDTAHWLETATVENQFYLRPSEEQLTVARYVTPEEFALFKEDALQLGFRHVESGPLVRSSYHAWEHVK